MRAYFTASIVGKKQYLPDYLRIIALLKKNGCDETCPANPKGINEKLDKAYTPAI